MLQRTEHKHLGYSKAIYAAILAVVLLIGVGIATPSIRSRTNEKQARNEAMKLMEQGKDSLAKGETEDALFAYMRAVKLSPTLPGANLELGKVLMLNGKGDEALGSFLKELENNPDNADTHLFTGFLDLLAASHDDELGKYLIDELPAVMGFPGMSGLKPEFAGGIEYPLTDALYHFKYVEEITPQDVRASLGLAMMSAMEGNTDEATSRLEEVIQRSPDNTFAADALVRIPELISGTGGYPDIGFSSGSGLVPGENGTLPPLGDNWGEVDPDKAIPDGPVIPSNPPDVSSEGSSELPSSEGTVDVPPQDVPSATTDDNGDLVLTEEAFRKEPRTRPIGAISYPPGGGKPVVSVGNRFLSGKTTMTVGETSEIPGTLAVVKLLFIGEGNRVGLMEDGEEYIWVRGKVEWVLEPKPRENIISDVPDGPPLPPE